MVKNTAFLALLTIFLLVGWVASEVQFLAPYKRLLFHEHGDVVWPIIASMYLGNVALLIMNLPMVPFFAKLLNTPYKVLYPAILLISVVGVYSVNFSLFDVGLLVVFRLLGYIMRKLDIPPAPLVLAFVDFVGIIAYRPFVRHGAGAQSSPGALRCRLPASDPLLPVRRRGRSCE